MFNPILRLLYPRNGGAGIIVLVVCLVGRVGDTPTMAPLMSVFLPLLVLANVAKIELAVLDPLVALLPVTPREMAVQKYRLVLGEVVLSAAVMLAFTQLGTLSPAGKILGTKLVVMSSAMTLLLSGQLLARFQRTPSLPLARLLSWMDVLGIAFWLITTRLLRLEGIPTGPGIPPATWLAAIPAWALGVLCGAALAMYYRTYREGSWPVAPR